MIVWLFFKSFLKTSMIWWPDTFTCLLKNKTFIAVAFKMGLSHLLGEELWLTMSDMLLAKKDFIM